MKKPVFIEDVDVLVCIIVALLAEPPVKRCPKKKARRRKAVA